MTFRIPRLLRNSIFVLTLALAVVILTYTTIPDHSGEATHFDTLIVLGCPTNPDGSPSPEQRERVLEAVRELQSGRAKAMIVSGGETLPGLVEADTMAGLAIEAGAPPSTLFRERHSRNTIQNIFFSRQIMQQQGWTTAEVVSSPDHLRRASLILQHWRFGWRVHAAPWPQSYTFRQIAPYYLYEALGTTALRWFGFHPSPFLPSRQSSHYLPAFSRIRVS